MISGFQASDIGQYGIDDLTWWEGTGTSYGQWSAPGGGTFSPFFNAFLGLFSMGTPAGPSRSGSGVGSSPIVSQVLLPTGNGAAGSDPEAAPTDPEYSTVIVSPPIWIDPDTGATRTVYEDAPGGIYETNRPTTDWDAVYDAYVILNPEEEPLIWDDAVGYFDTAVGWYDTLSGGNQQIAPSYPNMGQLAAAAAPPPLAGPVGVQTTMAEGACGPVGPRYGKICLATGVVTPLRRRRRRRLLTSGDLSDLAAAKSIIGGGAGLNALVVKAVRR